MKPVRSFASDNNAGVHPEVLAALAAANHGHVVGYGDDDYTRATARRFREGFGAGAEVFPVFNGTGANVLCLKALAQPHQAVICTEPAHINVDECGAPEAWTGCKLIPLATPDGKLTPALVEAACHGVGDQHHVQPRVISIAQSTEMGTVYRPREVLALARFAHARGMVLHMDGARISNAAASLGLTLKQATRDLGVDALSFGGTKNGLMGADAVVLFRKELVPSFKRNAEQANRMARLLESRVRRIRGASVVQKVDANGVFVRIPRRAIARIRRRYFFYTWDEEQSVVRWMCSWDTTEEDVREFAGFVSECIGGRS
jgi:threonine aldolase